MEFGSFMEFHIRENGDQAQAFEESFAQVDMAEDLGLDAVWLSESHFNPTRAVMSSPLIVASAIAARTKRLKVGTAVHILPLGNPLRIAEQAATLDQISQGRFEFGVGRSGLPGAYEGYNMSYAESRERFYEYLEIILKAWTNERFSYKGNYFSYDNVCLVPKPYQSPHPPIRVAATSSDTFSLLGKMGHSIFIGVRGMGMSQVAEQVSLYKQAWEEAGHTGPIDVSLRVPVYIADTKEKALSEPEQSFMKQFMRLGTQLAGSVTHAGADPREQRAERGEQLAALTWENVQKEKVAVGTPEMVIEQLQNMKETLSLSGIVAELNAGELIPRENLERSLRLFCEKVIPAFR
ncbi:MAG: LLM class flavin-dependent oxidoreductase [Chloroflexi bacterium]|nr:LLM class flavin-dependent oxidoreductase [Chloroflexota bacterium]